MTVIRMIMLMQDEKHNKRSHYIETGIKDGSYMYAADMAVYNVSNKHIY